MSVFYYLINLQKAGRKTLLFIQFISFLYLSFTCFCYYICENKNKYDLLSYGGMHYEEKTYRLYTNP
jgi:hypothetical protein